MRVFLLFIPKVQDSDIFQFFPRIVFNGEGLIDIYFVLGMRVFLCFIPKVQDSDIFQFFPRIVECISICTLTYILFLV